MSDAGINERFRLIRKETGLSQKDFGSLIYMTISEVKNIEYQLTTIREDRIDLICEKFGIDRQWLLTGEGDMHVPESLGDAIGEVAAAAAKNKPEEAMAYFQQLYRELGEAKFLLLYEVMKSVYPLDNEKKD